MNIMSRDFTTSEKVLLVILSVILLGLVYYQFVDVPVRDAIASYKADAEMAQTQIDILQARVLHLKGIQDNLNKLEESGNLSYMGSYNNSKEEVAFLNDILGNTMEYSVTFSSISRNGDQIRRNFTLQYKTRTYDEARKIMKKLVNGKYRCLVDDIRCNVDINGTTTVNQTATFYETMVGGTPDAALPESGASVKQ